MSSEMRPFYPGNDQALDKGKWKVSDVDGQLIVEEGGTIQLNCTIAGRPPTSNLTASDVIMSRRNVVVAAPLVRALSNRTAILRLPAVSLNESAIYHCFLPPYRHSYHHVPWGSYSVSVGRKTFNVN